MAQSFAISVGNANSYVATSRGGGVEILLNEYSTRSTPTFVAFNQGYRSMGNDAASYLLLNPKQTIFDLMVLLGKTYNQLDPAAYPFQIEEGPGSQPLLVVRFLDEEKRFTVVQVLAMLFTKLRATASGATECVISYPQFFDSNQKDALAQAAFIAGLKPLQVISDMAAVVLNYAYFRTTKEDKDKFIAFVNFGQSNLQTVIAWFTPKEDKVRILAAESEPIGGRNFDKCLAEHFVATSNLKLSAKQYLKLVTACEKLKRLLSANANDLPINVESLISEDKDFAARMDRSKFEEISQPILQAVEACLRRTLENARKTFDKFINETSEAAKATEVARAVEAANAVELAKKAELAKAHKKAVAVRVAEEAKAAAAEQAKSKQEAAPNCAEGGEVADGAALTDDQQNKGDQKASNEQADTKETPMDSEPEELTAAIAEETRAVQAAKAAKAAEKSMSSQANRLCKLAEVKFDLQAVEMVGGSTRVPAIKQLIQNVFNLAPSTTLNTDEAVARGCVLHCATLHPGIIVKREVKLITASEDIANPISRVTLTPSSVDALRRTELEMITNDRNYRARTEARNNLEEFIYAERSKLIEGDQYLQNLSEALDWLFSDEGEEASEEAYNNKLSDLKKISEARRTEQQPEQPSDNSTS